MSRWNLARSRRFLSLSKGGSNLPGLAVLGAVALLAAALMRRRFRLAYFLLHVAIALGERWSETRARRRLAKILTTHPGGGEVPLLPKIPESA